jgi:hypothetical protein
MRVIEITSRTIRSNTDQDGKLSLLRDKSVRETEHGESGKAVPPVRLGKIRFRRTVASAFHAPTPINNVRYK